jgi:hypothetical protein
MDLTIGSLNFRVGRKNRDYGNIRIIVGQLHDDGKHGIQN